MTQVLSSVGFLFACLDKLSTLFEPPFQSLENMIQGHYSDSLSTCVPDTLFHCEPPVHGASLCAPQSKSESYQKH